MPELVRSKNKSPLSSTDLRQGQLDTIAAKAQGYSSLDNAEDKIKALADIIELVRVISVVDSLTSDAILESSSKQLADVGTFTQLKDTE